MSARTRSLVAGLACAVLSALPVVAEPDRGGIPIHAEQGPLGITARIQPPDGEGGLAIRQETRIDGPEAGPAPAPDGGGPDTGALGDAAPTEGLPDLAPSPPFDVYVSHGDFTDPVVLPDAPAPPPALRFTTLIENRGRYSLDLVATPLPGAPMDGLLPTRLAQCVRFAVTLLGAPRVCTEQVELGTIGFRPDLRELRLPGLARYELRRDVGGVADMGPGGLVRAGGNDRLCVGDLYNWREDPSQRTGDRTVDETPASYERAWYRECKSYAWPAGPWRQGISPGWMDVAAAWYVGQQLPLGGLSDGVYWLTVTLNGPAAQPRLREVSYADNVAAARVELYAGGTKARLLWPMPPDPQRYWFDPPAGQPGE